MRLGIDFDRVLFRTDEFKQWLDNQIKGFSETYPEGTYDPEEHADRLGIEVGEIYDALEEASRFLYSDIDLIRDLPGFLTPVIVSRGDPVFQKKKIKNSGVPKLVEDIEIVQDRPKDVADIDFLVDDREKEVREADVPGLVFRRGEEDLKDVIEEVRKRLENS